MIKHLNDLEKDIGEYRAIHQMRKHISWYTKGMDNCNEFKRRAFEIIEKRVLVHEIEHFFKKGQE